MFLRVDREWVLVHTPVQGSWLDPVEFSFAHGRSEPRHIIELLARGTKETAFGLGLVQNITTVKDGGIPRRGQPVSRLNRTTC